MSTRRRPRGTAQGAKRSTRRAPIWPAPAAALVAALAWLPSLANGFARDDGVLIPAILGGRPLGPMLISDFWAPVGSGAGLWRPFVTLSLWIDGMLGHGAPVVFHAGNVIANAFAAGVLALLLQTVGLPAAAAFAGALWFAVMPAHAEAVAWVVGRTDVLCGLAALVALVLDRRARASGSGVTRVASLAAFALALLAKESAVALVLVVLALERADPRRPSTVASLRWAAPWAAVTVAWFVVHQAIGRPGGLPMYVAPEEPATWPARAWLLIPHFVTSLLPGVAHAPDAMLRTTVGMVGGVLATLVCVALAAVLAVRRSRALPGFTLFLAPLLMLLAAAFAGRAMPAGERLIYLSSAGAAWLLALAFAHAQTPSTQRVAWSAVVLLTGWSMVECVRLQPAWRDDASVFAAMVRAQPDNPVGWIGSAGIAEAQGDRAEVERRLARAGALGPRIPALHLARAALHYRYGEWPQVLASADSALAGSAWLADARVMRAMALVQLRRLAEAESETRTLLAKWPDNPRVLAIEGQRLLLIGDPAGAAARLESAVARSPNDVRAWYALGLAQAMTHRPADAQRAFERTVTLDPGHYDGWLGLARSALEAGDRAGAEAALARAMGLPEAADGRAAQMRAALPAR